MKQFYLRNLFIGLLLLFGFQLQAADYYWVGGAGSWSDLNHWSTTSGGAPNQSLIPNLNDDVHFDALSGLVNNTNLDLPTGSPAYCRNMTWTGVTAAVNFMYRGQLLNVYGNVELAASVRYGTQVINFVGTGAATLKMNGAGRYPASGWYNSINLNKPGGSLTLLDGIPLGLAVSTITLTAGSLDMSDFTHEFSSFAGNNSNVRSLDISNATLNMLDTWDYRGTNNTINTTNSTINALLFHSDRFSFPKVNVTAPNSFAMVINGTTFGQLTFTSTTGAANQLRIGANNTIDRLEFKSGGAITGGGNMIKDLFVATSNPGFYFSGNNTITGTLHANTPDCNALALIVGTAGATITFAPGAVADVRNVNMSGMTAAGSITLPIPVTGADGGGNSGWDFQPRATGTTMYWVGGAGDWNDKNHWSASSGGAGGYCVPFTGDDIVFDANSGFAAGNNTVTATTGNAWCHNMTWTNLTGSPQLNNIGKYLYIYGSLVLDPTLTLNGNFTLKGTEATTLTANGFNLGAPVFRMERTGANGGLTLTDNFTHPGLRIFHNSGKLLMPNRTLLLYQISIETSGVRTMDISNSTITLEQEWLTNSTNMTWLNNGAGSFILAKNRFITNGLTFPKVHCAGSGDNFAITNATIQELLFSNTTLVANSYALNGNNNIGTLEFNGAAQIRGNNTINNLLLASSRNYYFQNTQTINGLFRYNNPNCAGLGEMRSASGIATLNFGPSSTRDFNNVYLSNMAATGNGVPISVTGADAGGNTGFNITPSAGGPLYWVGGSGDWNQSAHWSTTSGGSGGACVPTVANDVFFDANSFSSGSSAVTISAGNAYCRNMNWTGATFAPVFTKPDALGLEIWGNVVLNPAVTMNARITFTGATNSTFTANGSTLGNLDIYVIKSAGYTIRFMDNYSNGLTRLEHRSGGLDLSGRTVTMEAITDSGVAVPTSLNITNANITTSWSYLGAAKSLQAAGSVITAPFFEVNGGTYNQLNVTAVNSGYIAISGSTIADLLFSNASGTSGAEIGGNNTVGRLEFKGKGYIGGTGNTIGILIFAPGKAYTFLAGSNTTITGDWFGSGTPCSPTQIVSSSTIKATITKTTGTVDFDYIRLNHITAAGVTPFKAREHSTDLGGNVNWNISAFDNSATITGFGPDRTVCADAFPVMLTTTGFFAGPSATFLWSDGSTGNTLSVTNAGTYSVNVTYPDGCTISDNITITKSTVTVAAITGSTNVCQNSTTTLNSTTPGGVWATNDAAIATVNATTGLVTGIAPGTATITYTVTNASSCSASQQAIVTVNPLPVVNAITGTLSLFESGTTTLSSTTPGGTWSSSNTVVATVDASGLVTGVSGGTADITYSVTNANGCSAASIATVTVDTFTPAKRELSIVKTGDAQEPSGNGGFTISLPSGIFAVENISITYTVGGTAGATDYTPLSGTAIISAGQNSVTLPVTVTNDALIENTETVLVTLSSGTGTTYTYTLSPTNGKATVNITDDENTVDKHVLAVTSAGNASESGTQGKFHISLPATLLASEDITVNYTISGSAINGTDYNTLSGSVVIPAGQNGVDVSFTAIDDKIIEGNENVILTLTGGTTATTGNFTASATQGSAIVTITDDDFSVVYRVLSVSAVVHAAEGGANGSFTIGLPAGYTATEAITVNYSISGTATNSTDYATLNGSVLIPAGQNNVTVPVTVTDDTFLESVETVILTINNGSSATFAFAASGTAGNGTVNIADNDNTSANRELSITKTSDAAEPATPGVFTISLPSGILASETITVNYTVSGTATAGADFIAIPATATIPVGQNSVQVPLNIIDDNTIESNETVIINITGGTSANLSYTPAAGSSSATANITDNDMTANSNIVLLTKVSDAIEGGTNGQYRISLPPGVTSSENVTVSLSMAGTATNNVDYTLLGLSAGNIVIPAGANEVLINVNANSDAIVEGPETTVLTLTGAISASGTFTIDPSGNGAVVIIIDGNAASSTPLQVIAGTNGSEPANGATFTVKLAGVATSALPVTIGYSLSGTATSGIDYQNIGTVTIPANTNSVMVNLNVLDDKIIEPTETVHFTLLSGSATDGLGSAFIFPPDPASDDITINITDNDAALAANRVLKVTPAADGAEPNANGGYTLSLPAGYTSATPITFSYVMSGTAIRNTDYAVSTVTLPANQNSVIIPLTVTDDQIIENTETAILTLDATPWTDGNGFTYTRDAATYQATVNITDNENTLANRIIKVVKIRDGAEGSSTTLRFNFQIPAGMATSEPITVHYTIGGTAVKGTDYNAFPISQFNGTATISTGSIGGTIISATIVDDQIIEGTETVTVTITSAASASFTFTVDPAEGTATADITDNDDLPANRVLSVQKTTDAQETPTNGLFTISLPAGVVAAKDLTVNYTVSGTATAGSDYTDIGSSVVITAGQNSATVAVPVIDDQLIESTETVVLKITDGDAAGLAFTASATEGEATVNILDNDNVGSNLIVGVAATANASEPGANGSFTVSLPAGYTASEDITVAYTIGGTATVGSDYTALSGNVVIPAGQTSVPVTVAVTDDNVIESAETVVMTITGATSTNFTLLPSTTIGSGTVLINDNDNGIPANKVLSIVKAADAAEPGTNGGFIIGLPAGIRSAEDITVNYTVDGTANPGTDYGVLSGSVTIATGQNNVSVPVTVNNDQLIELTETVRLTLNGGSSANFSFTGTGNATVNIADDESTTSLALAISKTANGAEPGTNGGFMISLPSGILATEAITVNYTISGTATAGNDYAAITAAVTIPAGQNSIAIPVTVTNDQLIEATETVIMTLAGGSSTSFTFTGTGSATVNITDDESAIPANLALSIANSGNAAEPATDGRFTISLPTGIRASEAITVNFTVTGSATAGTDYAAFTGTAVIPAGQNSVQIPVAVIDDQLIEETETVIVSLNGGSSTGLTFTGTGSATVLLTDDDNIAANLVLNVTKTADAAEPSANGVFNIALPAGVTATEDITVNYSITGTAIGGQDYSLLSGIVIIPAGDNSVDLPLTVTDDQVIENTETVTLAVTAGSSIHFIFTGTGSATLNIEDDDNAVPENLALSILKTVDGAEPGMNASFKISLPAGVTVAEDITVNYTISGTATASQDYTALSGTVTIPAEQNSVSIPIIVIDDNVYETAETLTLTLTGGTSASFNFTPSTTNATATANITDDDKMDQVIIFTVLPVKASGDPVFTLSATGGASGNPIIFTSSNPSVATVSGNIVTIVGVGTASITASQAGNAIYHAAANVTQVLTVLVPNTAPTLGTIDNQAICFTSAMQTVALSGITAGTETNQTITLSVSSNNPGLFSTLSVTQPVGGNAVLNYTLNNSAGGTALITVTVKDSGGTSNGGTDTFSRTFTLLASPLPQLLIEATPGTSVSKGQTLELKASGAAGYTWADAAGIINGRNSAILTVRPAQTTTYTVTGTSAAGCTSTQSITITVIEDYNLVANNVLTPNGDGKNDFFVIQNIDMYPNNEVRIFDRAGRAIYSKRGYTNDWDGTINGKPLHEETYYYIIDLGNGVKPKRGFISIVRKY